MQEARSRSTSDKPAPRQVLLMAAALEGALRSCNNLLERLHHSYFMYLLPSLDKFVPVEVYTLPPALQLLALFLLAANASLCLPSGAPPQPPDCPASESEPDHRPDADPGQTDAAGGASSEVAEVAETYPRCVMQPITIRGGWVTVAQSCVKVATVHLLAGAAGLLVHECAAHAAGGEPGPLTMD